MKYPTLGLLALTLVGGTAFGEPVATTLKGDLVSVDGKKVRKFDDAPLATTKYFAVYFSASWCGPCKAFTPDLVNWYQQKKPAHPEFELIFVSNDNDEDSMAAYMTEDKMPWPALKYSKIRTNKSLTQLAGTGIPCLVFIDADGKVLSHSYQGKSYVGPRKVLADIDQALGGGNTAAPAGAQPPAPAAAPATKSAGSSSFDDFFKKK